jgi:hypothetical protein
MTKTENKIIDFIKYNFKSSICCGLFFVLAGIGLYVFSCKQKIGISLDIDLSSLPAMSENEAIANKYNIYFRKPRVVTKFYDYMLKIDNNAHYHDDIRKILYAKDFEVVPIRVATDSKNESLIFRGVFSKKIDHNFIVHLVRALNEVGKLINEIQEKEYQYNQDYKINYLKKIEKVKYSQYRKTAEEEIVVLEEKFSLIKPLMLDIYNKNSLNINKFIIRDIDRFNTKDYEIVLIEELSEALSYLRKIPLTKKYRGISLSSINLQVQETKDKLQREKSPLEEVYNKISLFYRKDNGIDRIKEYVPLFAEVSNYKADSVSRVSPSKDIKLYIITSFFFGFLICLFSINAYSFFKEHC